MTEAEKDMNAVRAALDSLKTIQETGADDINASILEAEIALRRAYHRLQVRVKIFETQT